MLYSSNENLQIVPEKIMLILLLNQWLSHKKFPFWLYCDAVAMWIGIGMSNVMRSPVVFRRRSVNVRSFVLGTEYCGRTEME